MKKSLLSLVLGALSALSLPACTRDAVGAGEQRAASPEAAEFNRETSENSRDAEAAADSGAAARKAARASQAPQ